MKTTTALLLTVLLSVNPGSAAATVEERSNWQDTYTVSTATPHLTISNIWGGVRVRPGESGTITIAATEHRSAPDQARFDRSFEALRLDVRTAADGVELRVGDLGARWHRVNECRGCRLDIQFDVLVPPGTIIDIGTVMDGRIDVEGVTGAVSASNVNGPVRVAGIRECRTIDSVNGKVEIAYAGSPSGDCEIGTINGDITLDVPQDAGMDVRLDLFNGDLSSQLETWPLDIPPTVERVVGDGHAKYRIQKFSGLRIGAGGPVYSISSINGDVRIRKLK